MATKTARKVSQQRFLPPHRVRWLLAATSIAVALGVWWYFRTGNVSDWAGSDRAGIRLPLRYPVHGIDVSKFQGTIEWRRVRRMRLAEKEEDTLRPSFVFIKATEGQGLTDRAFQRNWAGARKAGLRRGAYHFYLPFRDPVRQANHFFRTVVLEKGDFAPVLDIELNAPKPDADIIRDLNIWLNLVETHYGIRPIIYTNPYFYKKFIRGHFDEYPLWIADYSNERLAGYPSGQVQFWQHSKSGWCEGIGGQVDFNVFLFDEDKMEDICLD
ncbi:MAG: glycoside hydrolase [Cytophagaceae bacterium]|nr:glycoside hydrolase [Cytophagaceae bacterium]